MSKTVSTSLQNHIYEKLVSKCNEKGVTVNEFLKECINFRMNNLELKTNNISKHSREKINIIDLVNIGKFQIYEK
jgi:hypothetical protein|tara:strand:+ start:173 stop:397 length:225 start_codon:yes stop_codon:yes gene_type:complete